MTSSFTRGAAITWLLTIVLATASIAGEPIKFSVTADSRGASGFVDVLKQLKAAGGPGVGIITAGDMDPAKTTREQIDNVFGPSLTWYPVVGNHETDSKETMTYLRDYFYSRLKDKVNPGPLGSQQTTYSFDVGEVHVAVINVYWNGKAKSGNDGTTKNVVPELRDWLKSDLEASAKPWKIVIGHEPAFPQPDKDWADSRHVEGSLDRNEATRDAFWKLLEEQHVAAYVCGHTHRYSRYQPKGSSVWQIDAAQARGDDSWKYDTFIIVTADVTSLKFEAHRNLKAKGRFEISDSLMLSKAGK